MMEYRQARPEEREAFMDLARLSFGFDLEQLIPKVYGIDEDPSPHHRVAVDEQGRIRSQVAVLPQTLTVAGRTLKAGFLGIVSTHPRDRGHGHMKALMDLWIRESQRWFDLVVLFGQRQRYEHHGFTSGGLRIRHLVEAANVRHALSEVEAEGLTYGPFPDTSESRQFALSLNEKRFASVERTEAHLTKVLTSFGQRAWTVLDRGRPLGYLTTNDEGSEVTELALSDPHDLKRVLKGFLGFSQRSSISVWMPGYETVLNQILASFAERTWVEPADMYHVVDFAKVLEAYLSLKHTVEPLSKGLFSAVLAGQPVTATVDEGGVKVVRQALPGAVDLNRLEAQSLLLSAFSRPEKVSPPSGWFPLPVFWYFADRF